MLNKIKYCFIFNGKFATFTQPLVSSVNPLRIAFIILLEFGTNFSNKLQIGKNSSKLVISSIMVKLNAIKPLTIREDVIVLSIISFNVCFSIFICFFTFNGMFCVCLIFVFVPIFL